MSFTLASSKALPIPSSAETKDTSSRIGRDRCPENIPKIKTKGREKSILEKPLAANKDGPTPLLPARQELISGSSEPGERKPQQNAETRQQEFFREEEAFTQYLANVQTRLQKQRRQQKSDQPLVEGRKKAASLAADSAPLRIYRQGSFPKAMAEHTIHSK
ncbi:hypothetical protein CDAR_403111 [Caerostris darwini]|uniref:Uncharacterized protein n=1 Tax=Caerostris darwini TaxID=1538125 RepID=A0AAV4X124_9ARAC|nr:hypothetical protein CDAR_403111 [Caerostris darwini]